jgi:hypothetical protein
MSSKTNSNLHDSSEKQQQIQEEEEDDDNLRVCSSWKNISSGSVHPCPVSSENTMAIVAEQSPIGKCLADALERLTNEDSKKIDNNNNTNYSTAKLFHRKVAKHIISTFGKIVVKHWTTTTTKKSKRTCNPQDGLLRAKVQYYNRLGSKWRIVLKNVELLPRVHLDPIRKKKPQQSLWERSYTTSSIGPIHLTDDNDGGLVQILAFDDIL